MKRYITMAEAIDRWPNHDWDWREHFWQYFARAYPTHVIR